MNIVSNSTPLIALAKMEALPLLRSLFKTVFVPTEVFREVARDGRGRPGAEEIIRASWIVNQKVRAKSWVKRIAERENLGRGEAEMIRLALERRITTVLTDDRRAEDVASRWGLRVLNTPDLFLLAKHRGVIRSVRVLLEAYIAAGYLLTPSDYEDLLEQAGEERRYVRSDVTSPYAASEEGEE
jgi:predicted nucleic acid-binding protein